MTKANVFERAGKSAATTRVESVREQNSVLFKEEIVTHSARVPKTLSREVKRIAAEEETTVQELTIEALSLLLKMRNK